MVLVRSLWLSELDSGLLVVLMNVRGGCLPLLVVFPANDVLLLCGLMMSECAHVVRVTCFAAGTRAVVSRSPLVHPCPVHSAARHRATSPLRCSSLLPFGFRQTWETVVPCSFVLLDFGHGVVSSTSGAPFACHASPAKSRAFGELLPPFLLQQSLAM
jgi:hypothetical protein